MNGHGLATPAAIGIVLLVGGFALVDSIRGCQTTTTRVAPTTSTEAVVPEPTTTTTDTGPAPQEDAPADWPTGELDGVLTYVAADDCRVRTIGLSSGRPRPPSRFVTDCRGFWAPKVGSRIAFGEVLSEGFFTVADLGHPRGDAGSYPIGAATAPMWSPEGRHIAWCDSPNTGIELEMLGEGRVLDFCPIAYSPGGDLAHVEGSSLVLGSRMLLTAGGPISWAQLGPGGAALVVSGRTLEHFEGPRRTATLELTDHWTGGPPTGSPDACYVAFPTDIGFRVAPLCVEGGTFESSAQAVSWSPDGRWIAMAMDGQLAFMRVGRAFSVFTAWPAKAVQLQWRS